ncbi:MAG: AIM24 family protein [Frankiaceae bacterium]|nr:AIM24 family protein [Frankiaceae bacterium]MBV9869712.1 AIM24 family protein [Frankiaceae bacterium]
MTGDASAYVCPYCRASSDPTGASCVSCGAAFDVRRVVSAAGWVKQPPIKDMARLKAGQSRVQISGSYVPVTEVDLAASESIYFAHNTILHLDPSVTLTRMAMPGRWSRAIAGLPVFLMTATGPGHVALSFDHPGETVAVPLQHGQVMNVSEHRLLAATGNVGFQIFESGVTIDTRYGGVRTRSYPIGRYIDQFAASDGPGLLLLHAPGNVLVRDLQPGETIVVQPKSMVYMDPTLQPSLHIEHPNGGGGFNNSTVVWLKLVGPGRVAISSIYAPEIVLGLIKDASACTVQTW